MKKMLLVFMLLIFAFTVNAQLKGDPWIFQAYKELYGRQPTAWELNIQNYNGGSWNNYGELKNYIQQYHNSLSSNGITVNTVSLANGKSAALFYQNGQKVAVDLISNDGGSIVASGAGNIVASGAGNIQGLGGVSFGNLYTVQSVGTKVVKTSGKGALVIRK